ncbi:cytochrome P450 monooxygenase pc-1 [Coprinopsis marcescibilis]|uniref:Cytochrome P450 monooxygenase pc-1 n=1 Tax=Coprinopsis marcescibilis TaxID=230819 RepID=A0A5C3KRF0_COPMA|nr:cytochrome P450 monooxygenase pc-1 [Coprinopsis marcescibilis]
MPWITPGVDFLFGSLVVPTVLHYGIASVGLRVLADKGVGVPRVSSWAVFSLALLAVPAKFFFNAAYSYWENEREAERRGARLAPLLQGKIPGNLDELNRDGLRELIDELGPAFNVRFLFSDGIFTVEPEHVKLILSTDFNNYVKGERFQFAVSALLGSGVFNSDGEMWKFHRSMTRPFFSRERVTDLERFDRHTQNALTLLLQTAKTGYAVDFQDIMQRLSLDVATDLLFGACVNSLQVSTDDLALPFNHPNYIEGQSTRENAFSKAFLDAQIIITERERNGWMWPLFEIFGDKSKAPMVAVSKFLDPIIQEAIRKNAERTSIDGNKDVEEAETLLDNLVKSTSDHNVLRDQTLNILLAGRDTISAVLTFTTYLLSLHPEVTERLRQEIINRVGSSRSPTYDDVREMKYLRAVINESMRLLPPVSYFTENLSLSPMDVRECVNGAVWPSPDPTKKPIYIPPGASTPYGPILIHTRKDLWGPDADEFDPDRFIDDRVRKYLVPNPFIFIPFNAGPRICLGQQFAYNQVSFVLVRLLQQFSSFAMDEEAFHPSVRVPKEWAEVGKTSRKAKERFRPKIVLTMACDGGMWLKPRVVDTQ